MKMKVLASGAFNLIIRRYAGPFWIRRKWLEKTQWLNAEQLRELQLKLLCGLLRHCYQTVTYYRSVLDRLGIVPEDIKTLEDLRKLPIITKQDVLNAGDSIVSTKYCRWLLKKAYTGGTTGTPCKLFRNLAAIGNEHAFVRRQWDWAGIGLRDKCAYLTGRVIMKPDRVEGKLYRYDPFMKELILSTYHLSPETAKDYIQAMKRYQVKAVVGYPSAVYLLARTCLDLGIEMHLKSVLTSSETLSESMKQVIERAFCCRVFDFYGGAERTCYVFTCEKGSYHVIPEYGITELIQCKDQKPGKCRVIATGFWNLAMPFIRYEMGDIVNVTDQTCKCGRAFPVVKCIEGRSGDVIRTPSEREYGAAILTHLLYGTDNILESQIIQETLDHIVIEYVPTAKFCDKDLADFRALIEHHLPSELSVDFKQVDAVQRTCSGKIRPVVSCLD